MDFNSIGVGSPFYVLNRYEGKKPVLQVGVIKSKSDPKMPYQTQTQNILNGLAAMSGQNNIVDFVVTIEGSDVPFNNLPVSAESSTYNNGNTFVSISKEATLQAIDARMQESRKHVEMTPYHEEALPVYEKMVETLNPQYAENKAQARVIQKLEERQDAQDKKLDQILSRLNDFFEPASKK